MRPWGRSLNRTTAYPMEILVNTASHVPGGEDFAAHVRETVEKHLHHWAEKISRVEVHVTDENGEKSGQQDQRCVMEARPRGMQPLAVTHKAANRHLAVLGAAERLQHLVSNQLGKRQDHRQGKIG